MKLLLLGTTCSGKSTIAKELADRFGLSLIEADDEVLKLNNGKWPSEEHIIDKHFETINIATLGKNDILFVTSWLEKEEILKFKQKGFLIVELHTTLETLLIRKQNRDKLNKLNKARVEENYSSYKKITEDKTIEKALALSIDTSELNPKQIITKINEILKKYVRKAVRAVALENDKVLLLFDNKKDYYSLPGGGVDDGDITDEKAILRELVEETGYMGEIIADLGFYEEELTNRINRSHCFMIQVKGSKARSLDSDEQNFENKWLTIDEAITKLKADLKKQTEAKYMSFFERELFFLEKAKSIMRH